MVKSKRLLTAFIVIAALTLPRFLFLTVEEYKAEYIEEDRMPDRPDDMPDWQALQMLICADCYRELDELQKMRQPSDNPRKRVFYIPMFDDVDCKCPVHPEVTLNRIADFIWDKGKENEGDDRKFEIPENVFNLYMPLQHMISLRKEPYEIWNWYICRECQKQISDRIAAMIAEGKSDEEVKAFAEKAAKLESLEILPGKLAYRINEIDEFYCAIHENTKMELTVREPVSPVVKYTLPEDTKYISRKYTNKSTGQLINLSIITAGKDRRSIHRPERCLQMQGYFPKDRRSVTIKLPGSKTKSLDVMKLKMVKTQIDPDTKETRESILIVIYWYASVERMTESNLKLMAYWAWDRLMLGKNYHWSYILLSSAARGDDSNSEGIVTKGMYNFVQEFFPKVER